MGICEVCGNDYDETMDMIVGNETRTFDSFECAIHALAPSCVTDRGRRERGRL
jgi:hypothetical protein